MTDRRPCIVLLMINQYADLVSDLAAQVKAEAGLDTVLLHLGPGALPDPARFHFQADRFAEIIDIEPLIIPTPKEQLAGAAEEADRAGAVEQRLGLSLHEIIRSDRHLGIGWVNGAWFPRSRYGLNTSYAQSVNLATRLCEGLEGILAARDVRAVVASPGAITARALVAVAQGMDIPVRLPGLTPKGGFFWASDMSFVPPTLAADYTARLEADQEPPEDPEASLAAPSARAQTVLGSLQKTMTWGYLVRRVLGQLKAAAGNYLYRRKAVYGGYLLQDNLRLVWSTWSLRRRFRKAPTSTDLMPADAPFIFYPLSIEPESTLMSESAMADNQLTVIDWLAKTAPAGWRVVVKEHPAFTCPRFAGFWKTLKRMPNVVIVSPFERGEDLVRRARVTAVIRSTMGIQAATSGYPVLTFHPAYYCAILPHVLVARSYEETQAALRRVAAGDLPDRAIRLRAGQAFAEAYEGGAVPLTDPNLLRGAAGGTAVVAADVAGIAHQLVTSLNKETEGVGLQ